VNPVGLWLERDPEVSAVSASDQLEAREQGRLMGIGISTYGEICAFGPSPATPAGGWESATVKVEPSGKVTVLTGSSPHGQGEETTYAQIVADELGVGIDDVLVLHGDTAVVQYGIGTFGSRNTAATSSPAQSSRVVGSGPAAATVAAASRAETQACARSQALSTSSRSRESNDSASSELSQARACGPGGTSASQPASDPAGASGPSAASSETSRSGSGIANSMREH